MKLFRLEGVIPCEPWFSFWQSSACQRRCEARRQLARADIGQTTSGPDLTSVHAEIKAKQYAAALAELKVLVVKYPDADVYSLLGHALWKTGDPTQGMVYYNKALALNPSHKGALEYQGELFVELGQIDKAKENLAKLNHLCWIGCEEQETSRQPSSIRTRAVDRLAGRAGLEPAHAGVNSTAGPIAASAPCENRGL